jgi:penicillin-binding protein 2
VGHGQVDLSDALCQSCNVYFFHHAGSFDPECLVGWALEFGLGQRTGIDLPGESAGTLPTPWTISSLEGHRWRTADTRLLAIGQSSLETTPLQVACMMAAVANGGLLVTPHVVTELGLTEDPRSDPSADSDGDPLRIPPPRRIADLTPSTLANIRAALERVVADPRGTAHAAVHLAALPIAGKTGTAETAPDEAEHAWFAAYLPAEDPKYVVVVALEHAGNASETACPVAKRVALRMHEMNCLRRGRPPAVASPGQPSDGRRPARAF